MKRYDNVKVSPGSATTLNQAGPANLDYVNTQLVGQQAYLRQQPGSAMERALAAFVPGWVSPAPPWPGKSGPAKAPKRRSGDATH